MQLNMEVLNTSNYSLGIGLHEYIGISYADLLISCQLNLEIGHIDLFGLLRNC